MAMGCSPHSGEPPRADPAAHPSRFIGEHDFQGAFPKVITKGLKRQPDVIQSKLMHDDARGPSLPASTVFFSSRVVTMSTSRVVMAMLCNQSFSTCNVTLAPDTPILAM
jgi:hypothetical protein